MSRVRSRLASILVRPLRHSVLAAGDSVLVRGDWLWNVFSDDCFVCCKIGESLNGTIPERGRNSGCQIGEDGSAWMLRAEAIIIIECYHHQQSFTCPYSPSEADSSGFCDEGLMLSTTVQMEGVSA